MPCLTEIKCGTTDPKVLSTFSSPSGDCRGESVTLYIIYDENWKGNRKKKLILSANEIAEVFPYSN